MEGHAGEHVPLADALVERLLGRRELDARVHSAALLGIRHKMRGDTPAVADGERDEVREEDLACLVRAQPRDGAAQPLEIGGVRAEVRLRQRFLRRRRETRLHDARDVAGRVPHDAAVRVIRADLAAEYCEHRRALRAQRDERSQRLRAHERRVAIDDERLAARVLHGLQRDSHCVTGAARWV